MEASEAAGTLRTAKDAGLCVDVTMDDGTHYMTGVHGVDGDAGTFTLFDRQTFGGEAETIELALDEVGSVTLTETPWRTRG